MEPSFKRLPQYNVCVIDIGSPKLGNIGWCLIDVDKGEEYSGSNLDALIPHIIQATRQKGLILGLEAPLFVPTRENLLLATKARKGEGRRPWSAGAGAQVLAMNLPIMIYLFKTIKIKSDDITYHLNEGQFSAEPKEVMLFEALVSGDDKGLSHIHDAQIMARSCLSYSELGTLPPSILEPEDETSFFNLAAAALLRCGLTNDNASLGAETPIYQPKPLAS